MMFDFSDLPVVDCHAHPFMPSREKKVYGRRYILSSDRFMKVSEEDVRNTLAYRMILIELARLLHLDPTSSDEEIIKTRNELVSFFMDNNSKADREKVSRLAGYYINECAKEGVNHDVAFVQMCLETGFLRFLPGLSLSRRFL